MDKSHSIHAFGWSCLLLAIMNNAFYELWVHNFHVHIFISLVIYIEMELLMKQ